MKTNLIEDKRKDKAQKAYTHCNPKRHIPLVSLLLWHKMVAVLGRLASSFATEVGLAGRQAGR